MSGRSPSTFSAVPSSRTVVSWPGREDIGGHPRDVARLGHRAVGERRSREPGEHVVAGIRASVVDVRPRTGRRGTPAGTCDSALARCCPPRRRECCGDAARRTRRGPPVGHAEQVGDHQQRERTGEALDELAPRRVPGSRRAPRRPAAHIASSFSLRRLGVISRISRARWLVCIGRVERRQLVAERQLVAVLLDQLGDVVRPRAAPGNRGTDRSPRCTTRTSPSSL